MTRAAAVLTLLLAVLTATTASALTQSDDVVVNISRLQPAGNGTTVPFTATVWNVSGEALQVELVLRLTGNVSLNAVGTEFMTCARESEKVVRCRSGVPLPHDGKYFITGTIEPAAERRLALLASVEWTRNGQPFTSEQTFASAVFPRRLEVTNTGDEGPGSLRAAIEYANANCGDVPCEITFSNPGRIIFNTPLPAITAPDIIIDGGDKDVILDGDALWYGSGLDFQGTGLFEVRNLRVRRFPWDGIAVLRQVPEGPFRSLIHNVTVDGNGSRGIILHPPGNALDIARSNIHSNGRSGIFLVGARDVRVDTSTIADNGASGIYVSAESRQVTIYRNTLRDNRHWGVTIGRGAQLVEVQDNTIHRNGIAGIDVGIDGPDGFIYDPAADRVGPPLVTAVVWNHTTGQITVSGTVPSTVGEWDVTLFFSSRPGDGDGFIGHTIATNGTFTLVLPDQLPVGTYITATAVHRLNGEEWSTEFSNTVRVEQ